MDACVGECQCVFGTMAREIREKARWWHFCGIGHFQAMGNSDR